MIGDKNPAYVHGHNCRGKRTTEYEIWAGIRKRCLNKNDKLYPYYGGRGIKVCDRWMESFQNFLEDMGNRPSSDFSMERIDNDGDYCPDNCRWATRKEQSSNRRNSIIVIYKDKTYCLKDFCTEHGIKYKNVWRRIRQYGWPIEKSTGISGVKIG